MHVDRSLGRGLHEDLRGYMCCVCTEELHLEESVRTDNSFQTEVLALKVAPDWLLSKQK